jgi:hypothetical protein
MSKDFLAAGTTLFLTALGYHSGLGVYEAFFISFTSTVMAGAMFGGITMLLRFGD